MKYLTVFSVLFKDFTSIRRVFLIIVVTRSISDFALNTKQYYPVEQTNPRTIRSIPPDSINDRIESRASLLSYIYKKKKKKKKNAHVFFPCSFSNLRNGFLRMTRRSGNT